MRINNQVSSMNIMLVEKSSLFREAMKQIFRYDERFNIVAEGTTLSDAERLVQDSQLTADILLLDHEAIKNENINMFAELLKQYPGLKVIILSEQTQSNYMIEALKIGASGYLLKEMDTKSFIQAIEDVYMGTYWFHPLVTDQFIKEYYTFLHHFANERMEKIEIKSPLSADIFTKREFEVLQLLAQGYSNKVIAETLQITSYTVSSHIRNILKKSDANDRTHAVVKAIANGWVQVATDKR